MVPQFKGESDGGQRSEVSGGVKLNPTAERDVFGGGLFFPATSRCG